MEISFIVPVFNEAQRLPAHIPQLLSSAKTLNLNYEIIIVDDGSNDRTMRILKELYGDNDHIKIVGYKPNKGKGEAFRYGFQYAQGEYVALIDVDIELDPQTLSTYMVELNSHEVVMASKRHPNTRIKNWPLTRKLLSQGFNLIEGLFLQIPLRDTQCGVKFFRREILEQTLPHLNIKQYAFDAELLYYIFKKSSRAIEMPITLTFERGHLNIISLMRFIKDFLALYYRTKFGRI